ncbi:MAG: amino acid-binding protein, partial [Raoultibacter sp.]
LAELLEFFNEHDVNIEYGYCFSVNQEYAIDVLKVSDHSIEDKLAAAGFEPATPKDIYSIV